MTETSGAQCRTCPFFRPNPYDGRPIAAGVSEGECRVRPPDVSQNRWPVVKESDWCGEHPNRKAWIEVIDMGRE